MPFSPAAILKVAKTQAFLVSRPLHVTYLAGMKLSAGYLLVLPKHMFLFVDARYTEAASLHSFEGLTVRSINDLQDALKSIRSCGFEADHVTVARLMSWQKKFPKTKFIPRESVLDFMRRTKTEQEWKLMKRADRITWEIIRRVPTVLKAHITEEWLSHQLHAWALELGADGLGFEPVVAFGSNTSLPHHRGTDRKLKPGDIVQIDVGATYRGYTSDASEVFFTAEPTPEQAFYYRLIKRILKTSIDNLQPGASNRALDKNARDMLREGNAKEEWIFPYALGHGVGLEVHEGITISSKAKETPFLSGEVVAIEPGIHIPGQWGMRVERIARVP